MIATLPADLADLSRLPPEALDQALRRDAGHTARWLHDAACQGLVEAQTSLGQVLLDGRGTPADAAAARRWFARAAEARHAPAANMLGRCLERGWGGAVEHPAAANAIGRLRSRDWIGGSTTWPTCCCEGAALPAMSAAPMSGFGPRRIRGMRNP